MIRNENETANAAAGALVPNVGHALCVFLCIASFDFSRTLRCGASVRERYCLGRSLVYKAFTLKRK